jgi:hypothetical protein
MSFLDKLSQPQPPKLVAKYLAGYEGVKGPQTGIITFHDDRIEFSYGFKKFSIGNDAIKNIAFEG